MTTKSRKSTALSRRKLLVSGAAAGGGLALGLNVPGLNGALDRQVPADENLSAIKTALAHNADATIRRLDGLNHLFQPSKTGLLSEYGRIEETFAPDVLERISDWVVKRK